MVVVAEAVFAFSFLGFLTSFFWLLLPLAMARSGDRGDEGTSQLNYDSRGEWSARGTRELDARSGQIDPQGP